MRFLILNFCYLLLLISCQSNTKTTSEVAQKDTTKEIVAQKEIESDLHKQHLRDSVLTSIIANRENLEDTYLSDYDISVEIANFFEDNNKFALIHVGRVVDYDTTKQDLYILHQRKGKWVVIDSMNWDFEPRFMQPMYTQTMDIDFDGKKELVLVYVSLSGSRGIIPYQFFKYHADSATLQYSFSLFTRDTVLVNKKNKTIMTGNDGGIYFQSKSVFQWKDEELVEIRRLEMTKSFDKHERINGDSLHEYIMKNNELKLKRVWFIEGEDNEAGYTFFENWR